MEFDAVLHLGNFILGLGVTLLPKLNQLYCTTAQRKFPRIPSPCTAVQEKIVDVRQL